MMWDEIVKRIEYMQIAYVNEKKIRSTYQIRPLFVYTLEFRYRRLSITTTSQSTPHTNKYNDRRQ